MLIPGLAVIIQATHVPRDSISRALEMALAYPDRSGQLRRWRGILLLALFIIYSAYVLAL